MIRFRNARVQYLVLLLLFWLFVNAAVRTVLLVMVHRSLSEGFGLISLITVYFRGAVNDLFPCILLLLPLLPFLLLKKRLWGGRSGRVLASLVFWLYGCAFLFDSVAETLFWDEFGSRFNFIAVDYLIYTTEVMRNIVESYPVLPLLAAVAASAAVFTLIFLRGFLKSARLPAPRSGALAAACLLLILAAFVYTPLSSADRVERELSASGVWSLFSAYKNNEIDYRQFYPVIPEDRALRLVHDGLREDQASFPAQSDQEWRRKITPQRREWRPNVVQIVVESLGSGLLGEHTPHLNAMLNDGVYLSGLMATGTRTVRGIEALTLSLPPTPGASIVRRPESEGLFNIGSVFRSRGYDTAFIYGGFGYFDNMNAFFSGNGFRIVDRASIPKEDVTFTNAWGVCDEDLFRAALREADACFQAGRPFYQFVLTTSNHRPFTYPEGRVSIPSGTGRTGAVAYTDYAVGMFLKEASTRPWFADTVFVLSGDHSSGAAGHTDLPPERYRIPAVFYSPGNLAPARTDTLCSQADIAPTLFSLLGWTYDSGFFGRNVLDMKPEEGRAWIGTYQILGLLKPDSLTVLEPLHAPVTGVPDADGRTLRPLEDNKQAEKLVDETIAWYQSAHDLYKRGALKENVLLRGTGDGR